MAANLTPQYLEAEAEYKKAQTPEERLACLRKMYTLLPKHKASEKLQADLKTRISETRDEVEREKRSPKKTTASHKVIRQGAGQYVVLGPPNAGKSSLLCRLTRATPEVAPYPFTTREPHVGMIEWEDVQIQLVDTPPITGDYLESYLPGLVQGADAAILMVDLSEDDGPFAAQAVLERLERAHTWLGKPPADADPATLAHWKKALLLGNKIDLAGAEERLEVVRDLFGARFPIHTASCQTGVGLEELHATLYRFLDVIRIYTKRPGKPAERTAPFTVPIGSTLLELACRVHQDFAETLKSARIWGTGVYDGQTVKRDHILHDQDVVELHT